MLIFVVGPSGAGKSELIGRARTVLSGSMLLDLDQREADSDQQEWAPGWEARRWPRDKGRILQAQAESGNRILLVDVGAGSLQTPEAREYFESQAGRTIAIMVPWEVAKERKHQARDEKNLRDTEYSTERLKVYKGAKLTVNNSGSEQEGTAALLRAIRLLSPERATEDPSNAPALTQFRLVKDRDEGTLTPYIARFWSGLLGLRNQCLGFVRTMDTEKACRQFDATFTPVSNQLDALRAAEKAIRTMVSDHREGIANGTLISFQANAVNIHESINRPLREEFEKFLNAGTRALKGMQTVMDPFRVPLGFFFQKQGAFDSGAKNLETAGHIGLVAYLKASRAAWSEQFLERRNQMEHFGWHLDNVNYPSVAGRVAVAEPLVDGVLVSAYADHMARRVLAFVEEITVYGFSLCLPQPAVILAEVPLEKRNPINAERFCVTMAGQLPRWEITYDDQGFH